MRFFVQKQMQTFFSMKHGNFEIKKRAFLARFLETLYPNPTLTHKKRFKAS